METDMQEQKHQLKQSLKALKHHPAGRSDTKALRQLLHMKLQAVNRTIRQTEDK